MRVKQASTNKRKRKGEAEIEATRITLVGIPLIYWGVDAGKNLQRDLESESRLISMQLSIPDTNGLN